MPPAVPSTPSSAAGGLDAATICRICRLNRLLRPRNRWPRRRSWVTFVTWPLRPKTPWSAARCRTRRRRIGFQLVFYNDVLCPNCPKLKPCAAGSPSRQAAVISRIVRPPSSLAVDLHRAAAGQVPPSGGGSPNPARRPAGQADPPGTRLGRPHRHRAADDGPRSPGRPARPQTPAAGHRTRRTGRADFVLGPARTGRRATRLAGGVRRGLWPCEDRSRRPGDLGSRTAPADRPQPLGRSRSRCSIKRPWPAWEISMPRKSCTVPAFIRPDRAAACGKPSGSASTPRCSACCTTRSSTKARRFATAPIASPATCRATISSITASISGTGRPAWPAERPASCGSCRPSDRRSIVRRASEKYAGRFRGYPKRCRVWSSATKTHQFPAFCGGSSLHSTTPYQFREFPESLLRIPSASLTFREHWQVILVWFVDPCWLRNKCAINLVGGRSQTRRICRSSKGILK